MSAGRGAALGSVLIAAATVVLTVQAYNGAFSHSCGTWGFDCLGYAIAILSCGSLLGLVIALWSLAQSAWRGWPERLGLLLNALPLLTMGLGVIWLALVS